MNELLTLGLDVAATMLALLIMACMPEPKYQPCHDDGDCKESLGESAYCVRSRCVQCVTSAACSGHEICLRGMCKERDGSQ
jgi:hypothetical protein